MEIHLFLSFDLSLLIKEAVANISMQVLSMNYSMVRNSKAFKSTYKFNVQLRMRYLNKSKTTTFSNAVPQSVGGQPSFKSRFFKGERSFFGSKLLKACYL